MARRSRNWAARSPPSSRASRRPRSSGRPTRWPGRSTPGERVVVGVNKFTVPSDEPYEPLRVDPAIEEEQGRRLAELRASAGRRRVRRRIDELKRAAAGGQNVLVPMREALRGRATVGEVCDALRDVWGIYRPTPDLASLHATSIARPGCPAGRLAARRGSGGPRAARGAAGPGPGQRRSAVAIWWNPSRGATAGHRVGTPADRRGQQAAAPGRPGGDRRAARAGRRR